MFKGRFGNFYLYKVWAFTVVSVPILALLITLLSTTKINYFSLQFIFPVLIYGFVFCLPSLITSEIFYKSLSKKKKYHKEIFILTLIFSLITTNLTYFIFYSFMINFHWQLDVLRPFTIFCLEYTVCLIAGFFIFKQKPEKLNFKP